MTNDVAAISSSPEEENQIVQSSPTWRRDLAAVTGLAFAVRLGWVWFGGWVAGDSAWYVNTARNLTFYHVFSGGGINLAPTAFRPPLYSAVIALLWFGDAAPIYLVLLLQAILGAATVLIVYLLARDQFSRRVALLAATGLALAPMTGHFTAVILSETLFTFILTFAVFWWARSRYVASGLIFGLAALTRVVVLPFVAALPLLTLLGPWRSCRRGYLTITLLALAIASSWTVRNAVTFHRFIPVAAGGYGTNLFLGSIESGEADDVKRRKGLLSTVDRAGGNQSPSETEFDRERLLAALRRIVGNPWRWLVARTQQYPRLFVDSGSYIFADESLGFRATIRDGLIGQALLRSMFILGNLLVFVFAVVGVIAERSRFVSLSHLTLFPIFLMLISLPFWIEPRYGLPMMPLVAILSAVGFLQSSRSFTRPGKLL